MQSRHFYVSLLQTVLYPNHTQLLLDLYRKRSPNCSWNLFELKEIISIQTFAWLMWGWLLLVLQGWSNSRIIPNCWYSNEARFCSFYERYFFIAFGYSSEQIRFKKMWNKKNSEVIQFDLFCRFTNTIVSFLQNRNCSFIFGAHIPKIWYICKKNSHLLWLAISLQFLYSVFFPSNIKKSGAKV